MTRWDPFDTTVMNGRHTKNKDGIIDPAILVNLRESGNMYCHLKK